MEIPEMSIIRDFQAGVNCLQNPSIITQFFTLLGMEILPQISSLWKWSAVILAIFAAFKRLKLIFIRFRGKVTPSLEQFVEHLVEEFDFSDDDDEDDKCSSVSSMEDFSEEEDEDFRVAGGDFYMNEKGQNGSFLSLRRRHVDGRRLSWTDFSTGSSVVKLWDGIEESCKNIVSIWDSTTFFEWDTEYQISSESTARKQALTLTAEVNGNRNHDGVVLSGYDGRMTERKTAFVADWARKSKDVEKVYVRDGIEGVLTVGDVRNLKTPLKTVKLRGSNGNAFENGD